MTGGGFDYSGFTELMHQTERMLNDWQNFICNFLLKQGLDAINRVKNNTPVDTGLLRNAWTLGDGVVALKGKWNVKKGKIQYRQDQNLSQSATLNSVIREGNTLKVIISNPVEYASFIEYGHMNRGRDGWVEGYFMCTFAIADVEKKMPARFQREFVAWARGLGADTR
ncbi:MAG: HK97 gp10 family phage protein [Peptococcaceae bacterium]